MKGLSRDQAIVKCLSCQKQMNLDLFTHKERRTRKEQCNKKRIIYQKGLLEQWNGALMKYIKINDKKVREN